MTDDVASLTDLRCKFQNLSEGLKSYESTLAVYEQGFDDRVATLKASLQLMHMFYGDWMLMEVKLSELDNEMLELKNCLDKFVENLTASPELLSQKESLEMLQKSRTSSIETLSLLNDKTATLKERYDAALFVIFVIESQHFPLLRKCIFGNVEQNVANIPEESWSIFYDVLKIVSIYQLRFILAAQPTSNITIVECVTGVRFAYWKHNEDVVISVNEDEFSIIMGPVKDQLYHDLCWAFVTAELVSAVRRLKLYDVERVEYSCQDLADFADKQQRSERKVRNDEVHYCYSFPVRGALEYVSSCGIEREEDRPFQVECQKDVRAERNELNLGYIGKVVSLSTIEEVLEVLKDHPVAASIPIFEPEFGKIGDKIYRGPTSPISNYMTMHAVNLLCAGEDKKTGQKYLKARNTHGEKFGKDGNFKISIELIMICLTRDKYAMFLEYPISLASEFVYPEMLSPKEEYDKKKGKGKQSEEIEGDRKRRNTGKQSEEIEGDRKRRNTGIHPSTELHEA